MGEAQAAQCPPAEACRGATVTKGGYRKWDIETRHSDLVSGMVQHHAAMFFSPGTAAPRAVGARAGAVLRPPRPVCLRGGICN